MKRPSGAKGAKVMNMEKPKKTSTKKKDTLTDADVRKLKKLSKGIVASLGCDLTADGPCMTDRIAALKDMAAYLRVHGWIVEEPDGHPALA